jgi:hypothetical protein
MDSLPELLQGLFHRHGAMTVLSSIGVVIMLLAPVAAAVRHTLHTFPAVRLLAAHTSALVCAWGIEFQLPRLLAAVFILVSLHMFWARRERDRLNAVTHSGMDALEAQIRYLLGVRRAPQEADLHSRPDTPEAPDRNVIR